MSRSRPASAPATIERILLWRYAGRAFEQPTGALDPALAAAAQGSEVLIRCSPFCPHCLQTMARGWSAGSFACSAHRVLLLRHCPTCAAVPVAALRDSWPSDRDGVLSDPTRCAYRSSRVLCRGRLARADTPPVSDVTLAAQRRINLLLDDGGPNPTLAGVELDPPTYLRSLCRLVHRHTPTSAQRRSTARWAQRVRDDPAGLAAVLPTALALADLPEPDTLAEALRQLADDRYHNDGLTLVFSNTGPMSEPLKAVLRRAISQAIWASTSRQLGLHPGAHRRPGDLDPQLGPEHVPQPFWAEDYHREIADLLDFDDLTDWLGRRFCSVPLARMLSPLDWDAAARHLDFLEPFTNTADRTTFAKLRSNHQFTALIRRVKRIANRHAERGLIDHKQRRVSLATREGIDIKSLHLLERTSGATAPQEPPTLPPPQPLEARHQVGN
jgi:hypothetical protein